MRQLFQAAKGGHTGALNPLATGVLPSCLGQATKLSSYLLDADKRYLTRASVGACTDTGDAEGDVTRTSDSAGLSRAGLETVLPRFLGEIRQRPPMYSALKRGGRPLYELARAGQEVEREERPVRIEALALTGFGPGWFELDVRCSKGTYIRTLVEDLAAAAGQCAHVAELRRTAAGPFGEAQMVSAATLERAAAAGLPMLDALLLPPLAGLPGWRRIAVDAGQAAGLAQGRRLAMPQAGAAGPVAVTDAGGVLLGLAEVDSAGVLAPRRWLAAAS